LNIDIDVDLFQREKLKSESRLKVILVDRPDIDSQQQLTNPFGYHHPQPIELSSMKPLWQYKEPSDIKRSWRIE